MKKIILALAIIGFFAVSQVRAQGSIFAIEYSVGIGTGDVKDFVSTISWRGMSMDYRYFVQPNVGVGFETGYNLFYEEKPYATYTQGTESISGKQYRYLHMVPVLAAVDYYFKPDEQFNPFIGLGIGTLYSYRDVDMGMFTMEHDAWQFALRPEVGTTISTPGIDFLVALKYNMAFKANDTESQNYLSLNLGIVF